jgi:hypothetical protein
VKRLVASIRGDYRLSVFYDASEIDYEAVAHVSSNDESTLLSFIVRIIPEDCVGSINSLVGVIICCRGFRAIDRGERCFTLSSYKSYFWTDSITSLA